MSNSSRLFNRFFDSNKIDVLLSSSKHRQNFVITVFFFNFMSWNVNSIAKNNFQRVRLIEAHNSIFNYDLISICESSLNDWIKLPDILLKDKHYTRHGEVGLFYKNSLPIKIRWLN